MKPDGWPQVQEEGRFHDVAAAIAYAVAHQHAAGGAGLRPPYNDLTAFVLRQWRQMPDWMRLPVKLTTVSLDWLHLLQTGRWFHSAPPESRVSWQKGMRHSRFAFARDILKYHESLVTLRLYSREPGPGAAKAPSAENVPPPEGVIAWPKPDMRMECVVVGSGPGGAMTACSLAEAGREVLLVEEGAFAAPDQPEPFSAEEMLLKYRHGGQTVAWGKNKISYVEGCCVGGGSEINSGLYHRLPDEVLETWRTKFEVQGLESKDLHKHFLACEEELSVSPLPCRAPTASLKLHAGARQLGWNSIEVPRWFKYDGQTAAGTRQTMSRTFIPRYLRAGGKLLPTTRVTSLERQGTVWELRAWHAETGPVTFRANTVFICGGAVQTPALLRGSGLARNVGNTLQMHPTVKVTAEFEERVNSEEMGVPVHQVKEFSPALSFGCSISSLPYVALGMLGHNFSPERWTRMANYYAMISPEGSGRVRSLPGFTSPLVRFALTPTDRRQLAVGLRKLCRMLLEAGARAVYPTGGTHLVRKHQDLERLPASIDDPSFSLMTIHLFSSCPMGERKDLCATDSFGKVHGTEGLYINDASLLCGPPGVNPQGTILAIARRNVQHFLEQ